MDFKNFCTGIIILFAGLFILGTMGSCIFLEIQKERAMIELYKAAARGESSNITIISGEINHK